MLRSGAPYIRSIFLLWCISIMDAHRLSAIIALLDIFMQEDIFFMSDADIFIMSGCIFIMLAQRLFFIIAVLDIRLHDIIMFMSAWDIFMPVMDEWFIWPFLICAVAGEALMTAASAAAKIMFIFIVYPRINL